MLIMKLRQSILNRPIKSYIFIMRIKKIRQEFTMEKRVDSVPWECSSGRRGIFRRSPAVQIVSALPYKVTKYHSFERDVNDKSRGNDYNHEYKE